MDFMVVIVVVIGFSVVIGAEHCSYHFVDKKEGHLAMECRDIEFHHVPKYLSQRRILISMLITGLHKSASEIGELVEAIQRCHVVSIRMVFTSNFLPGRKGILPPDTHQSRDRVGSIRSLEICSQTEALALYILANLRQLPSSDQGLRVVCKLPNLRTFIEAKVPPWQHVEHRNAQKQCATGHETTLNAPDKNRPHLGMKRSLSAPEIKFVDASSETECVLSHRDLAEYLDWLSQILIIDQGEVLFSLPELTIPSQELRSFDWLASPEPSKGKISKSRSQRIRCSFGSLLLGSPSIISDSVSVENAKKPKPVSLAATLSSFWPLSSRLFDPIQRAIPRILGIHRGLRRAVSDPELVRQSDHNGSSQDWTSSAFVKRQVKRTTRWIHSIIVQSIKASLRRSMSLELPRSLRSFMPRTCSAPKSSPDTMDSGSAEGEGETRRNQKDDKPFRSASEQTLITVPDHQKDTQDHVSSTIVPGGDARSLDSSPRSLFRRARCSSGQSLDCIWKPLGGSVNSTRSDGYVKYTRLHNPSQAKPLYKQIRPRLRRPATERTLMATETEFNQAIIIQDAPNNNRPSTAGSKHRPAGYKFRSSDEAPHFASRRAAVFLMAGIAVFILLAIAKVVFFCKSDSSEESRLKRSDLAKQIDQFAFAKQLRGEGLSPLPTDLFVDFSTMPHVSIN